MSLSFAPAFRSPVSAFALAALALAAPAAAQIEAVADLAAGSRTPRVALAGGELVGLGPDYRVRFLPGGPEFRPVLGRAAERSLPLTLELESVRVGGTLLSIETNAGDPFEEEPGLVVYPRGAGVSEVYALRPEGVEQSFVLSELPAARGELVVTLRVKTELPAPSTNDSTAGFRYVLPGSGGVSIGAVTGLDARGQKSGGGLRLDGQRLELSLPAAFVERAATPLVLDPLIGTIFSVASGTGTLGNPDAAYDVSSDRYLVAYERFVDATTSDVLSVIVSGTGTSVLGTGPVFLDADHPAVASINLTNRFLVVCSKEGTGFTTDSIVGASSTAFGSVSNTIQISTTSVFNNIDPDVGGEATLVDDDAIVVWKQPGGVLGLDNILGAQVTVPSSGDPFVLFEFPIETFPVASSPAISKSGGSSGRFAVVWSGDDDGCLAGIGCEIEIWGTVVDRNGNLLDSTKMLIGGFKDAYSSPDVDGDGSRFMLVCHAFVTLAPYSPDNHTIIARELFWGVFGLTPLTEKTVGDADAPDSLSDPAVASTGTEDLIVWSRNTAGVTSDVALVGLTVGCVTCEGELLVASSVLFENEPALVAKSSGQDALSEDALVTWRTATATDLIEAVHWDGLGAGGTPTDLGGACANATAGIGCPATPGSTNFTHELTTAPVFDLAFLLLAFDEINASCGSCTLVPNPYTGFIVSAGTTGVLGTASVAMPIPADPALGGLSFVEQWAIVPGSSGCAPLGADLSNALRITIQ